MRTLIISAIPARYETLRGLIELQLTGTVEWASSPSNVITSIDSSPYQLILSDQAIPSEAPYIHSHSILVFYKGSSERQTPEGFFWSATSDELINTLKTLFPNTDPLLDAFLPLRSALALQLSPAPVDLYLKLSDFKFVRIHKSGDPLDSEDLRRFEDRSIESFYINRKDCDTASRALSSLLKGIPDLDQASKQMSWHNVQRTANLIANTLGFSPQLLENVKENLDQTLQLFSRNSATSIYVKDLLHSMGGNFTTAHTYLTAVISVGLLHRLGWETEKNSKKLVICSILHDITLTDDSLTRFKTFEELSMTNLVVEVDLTAHHRNQQFVLNLLEKWQPNQIEMPALLKYHYDCFFKGPERARSPNQLASLFQLSHEIAHYAIEDAESTSERIELNAFLDRLEQHRTEASLLKRIL